MKPTTVWKMPETISQPPWMTRATPPMTSVMVVRMLPKTSVTVCSRVVSIGTTTGRTTVTNSATTSPTPVRICPTMSTNCPSTGSICAQHSPRTATISPHASDTDVRNVSLVCHR